MARNAKEATDTCLLCRFLFSMPGAALIAREKCWVLFQIFSVIDEVEDAFGVSAFSCRMVNLADERFWLQVRAGAFPAGRRGVDPLTSSAEN